MNGLNRLKRDILDIKHYQYRLKSRGKDRLACKAQRKKENLKATISDLQYGEKGGLTY